MKLFGISNHGLATIGILVTVLWGVIFMEQSLNRQTQRDYDALRNSWGLVPAVNREAPTPGPKPAVKNAVSVS